MKSRWTMAMGLAWAAWGCRQDMFDQPRCEPMERSEFFEDGSASRPAVEGTIARGRLTGRQPLHTGLDDQGGFVRAFPMEITHDDLVRGAERFDVHCAPCHDRTGRGNGMIVQHGFRRPPSLHEARLRDAAPGYLFDVITRGFGTMASAADRLSPVDRWRTVAYIRVLQRAQAATLDDVPEPQRSRLMEETP